MFYVGRRQDFGPCVLYCSFFISSEVWESKPLFIHSDSEIPESQMFACMYCFWRKFQTPVVSEKKVKYLVSKLMIVHSYFSIICLWSLDCFFHIYCAIYWKFYIRTVLPFWNNKKGGSMIWINSVISTGVLFGFCNSFTDFESKFVWLSL